jgi:hypothetical protein
MEDSITTIGTEIDFRSHLKKVSSSDTGVELSFQVLDILEYASGLILGLVFRLRLEATPDK